MSDNALDVVEKIYMGVDGSVGKSLQNLASLESKVEAAHAAIEALNAHAATEQIMTFTCSGGNRGLSSVIYELSKESMVYQPVAKFQTFAASFPFFGDMITRASDGSVVLVNSDLQLGLSLDRGHMSQVGWFGEATLVGPGFINMKEIQKGFQRALWHIHKMIGENKLPDGYEFDYGAY